MVYGPNFAPLKYASPHGPGAPSLYGQHDEAVRAALWASWNQNSLKSYIGIESLPKESLPRPIRPNRPQ